MITWEVDSLLLRLWSSCNDGTRYFYSRLNYPISSSFSSSSSWRLMGCVLRGLSPAFLSLISITCFKLPNEFGEVFQNNSRSSDLEGSSSILLLSLRNYEFSSAWIFLFSTSALSERAWHTSSLMDIIFYLLFFVGNDYPWYVIEFRGESSRSGDVVYYRTWLFAKIFSRLSKLATSSELRFWAIDETAIVVFEPVPPPILTSARS